MFMRFVNSGRPAEYYLEGSLRKAEGKAKQLFHSLMEGGKEKVEWKCNYVMWSNATLSLGKRKGRVEGRYGGGEWSFDTSSVTTMKRRRRFK
jgi:hypothetical protein